MSAVSAVPLLVNNHGDKRLLALPQVNRETRDGNAREIENISQVDFRHRHAHLVQRSPRKGCLKDIPSVIVAYGGVFSVDHSAIAVDLEPDELVGDIALHDNIEGFAPHDGDIGGDRIAHHLGARPSGGGKEGAGQDDQHDRKRLEEHDSPSI